MNAVGFHFASNENFSQSFSHSYEKKNLGIDAGDEAIICKPSHECQIAGVLLAHLEMGKRMTNKKIVNLQYLEWFTGHLPVFLVSF